MKLKNNGVSKVIKRVLQAGCVFIACLFLAIWLLPLPDARLNAPQAYRYYDQNQRLLSVLISSDEFFRMHIPIEQVSPLFIKTLLLQEDQYFYVHPGINPLAIMRAAFDNVTNGRVVSGASTISMQLARMLQRRKRTFSAKLIESFRALQLEWRFSKQEILAHYLAVAPYGGNIEGLQAAAFSYFGKQAINLSPGEIALLVALPKSPNRYRPDRYPENARQQRDIILANMHKAGLINQDQFERSLAEAIPSRKYRFPGLIPHTAWHLRQTKPDAYVVTTTLDENLQKRTRQLLRQHLDRLKNDGITNASAVIIDNETRQVRAVVGSADYYDVTALGSNDGARSLRSPGSTLKPFVYGLAMQQGLISEKTILYDIPVNYGGYSPQNYSQQFSGPVTAREALTESLNVVAVNLSQKIGIEKLHSLLKKGGINHINNRASYYGLPLALGGVEVSLIQLTNLYASLANGGEYQPHQIASVGSLTQLQSDSSAKSVSLLSPEASWLISHILTDVERPDFPQSWRFSSSRPTIAWKTGTSYGHQDAWSVGYNRQYTVGIWVGNFDAKPARKLSGSTAAAPLLFDIFQAITPPELASWFHKPAAVKQRMVCATCGRLANNNCQQKTREYFIDHLNGETAREICEVPQLIAVDRRTNQQASSATPAKFVTQKVFNIWPAAMATFLLKRGVPVHQTPAYDQNNMAGQKYYPPQILSPVSGTEYYKRLDRFDEQDHGIKLEVAVTNRVRKVSWFMNERLLSQVKSGESLIINPAPGQYQLTAVDDTGGKDEVMLSVRDYREVLP